MKQAKVLNEAEIRHLLKVCELTRYAERNRLIVMFSFLKSHQLYYFKVHLLTSFAIIHRMQDIPC